MEFLLYLDKQEQEILQLIYKANYKVVENSPLCLIGKKYFGFLMKDKKQVVICTENAKDYGGYYPHPRNSTKTDESFKTSLMIKKAIRHEAVHVAQECNGRQLLPIKNTNISNLSPYKLSSLRRSVLLNGEENKVIQAYILEDKPRLVIATMKKYCL